VIGSNTSFAVFTCSGSASTISSGCSLFGTRRFANSFPPATLSPPYVVIGALKIFSSSVRNTAMSVSLSIAACANAVCAAVHATVSGDSSSSQRYGSSTEVP